MPDDVLMPMNIIYDITWHSRVLHVNLADLRFSSLFFYNKLGSLSFHRRHRNTKIWVQIQGSDHSKWLLRNLRKIRRDPVISKNQINLQPEEITHFVQEMHVYIFIDPNAFKLIKYNTMLMQENEIALKHGPTDKSNAKAYIDEHWAI